ncbi:MAG: hypothetical protein U0822_18400 [Anaerolineae bacterium]
MEITVQVPDKLGRELQQVQDRLPEVLERGLREVLAEATPHFQDEQTIISVLASQPTPEQVLALHPSPALQARASELLARGKASQLEPDENAELERLLFLEHLVRMAKAYAYHQSHQ